MSTSCSPHAKTINVRSMEHMRRQGPAEQDRIRAAGLRADRAGGHVADGVRLGGAGGPSRRRRWRAPIAEARSDLPVAGIACNMDLVRRSVRHITNELVAEGILNVLHHLIDVTSTAAVIDAPQALVLAQEPRDDTGRYDALRACEVRHAS